MEEKEEKTTLLERTAQDSRWTFIPYLLLQCSVGLVASIHSTIYPIESSKKGATASQFGPVFGMFFLAQIIFSPLIGRWLPVWGVKKLYLKES